VAIASRNGDEISVSTDWTEKDLASQVPGLNYHAQTDTWDGPLTWGVFVSLCGIFQGNKYDGTPRLSLDAELYAWYTERWQWYAAAVDFRDRLHYDGDHEFDARLYPFQKGSVAFHDVAHTGTVGTIDCSEMGVGKTCLTLSSLRLWHERDANALPAIVISPNSVKHVWANEASMWFPEAHPYVIEGSSLQRRKRFDEAFVDPLALVLVNFEAVKLHSKLASYGSVRMMRCPKCGGPKTNNDVTESRCHAHKRELQRFEFRSVIIDEAHRMKDPKAQQTRACWAVQHQPSVNYRIALTGTPIANDVGDLWSLLHGIAPDDFKVKTKFTDRYALMAWNHLATLDIVGVRPDTRGEFDQIIAPRLRRVLKAQVLTQLPPKVRETRHAPLTPTQRKMYKQMEDELLVTFEDSDDVLVAPNNLTKATRLLQFASASCELNEEGKVLLKAPSAKLDVLEEILGDLGTKQIAVCALSRQLIELAAERLTKLKISHRLVTGKVTGYDRAENIKLFQEGRVQVMLFTLGAGGTGITLTAADTIVFLQRSWSPIDNKQAEDRVHRIGSERHETVTVIDVIAPGTIEVRQLQSLRAKLDQLEDVVHDRERLLQTPLSLGEVE
jgi:SNF2 family DNA or RNA helicase